MIVLPSAFIPPKITLLLHWAEPLFSKNFIDFNLFDPFITKGNLDLFLRLNDAPNLLNGSVILQSLLDKLLSPIILLEKVLSLKFL